MYGLHTELGLGFSFFIGIILKIYKTQAFIIICASFKNLIR